MSSAALAGVISTLSRTTTSPCAISNAEFDASIADCGCGLESRRFTRMYASLVGVPGTVQAYVEMPAPTPVRSATFVHGPPGPTVEYSRVPAAGGGPPGTSYFTSQLLPIES